MSNHTYMIYAPNGRGVEVDKDTNKIYFAEGTKEGGKYNKKHSDIFFKSYEIEKTSPYINYKPNYLDPEFHTGQSSTLLQFKDWQKIYLKDPVKGAIAPWTKAEKAYYQSLKTKRERYKYLIIRSGLRSSVIDIPFEAYCNIDEQGNIINKDYKELYAKVEANRGLAHLSDGYLFMAEWELAAGFLGDRLGFAKGGGNMWKTGFTTRAYQSVFLAAQLGNQPSLEHQLSTYSSSIALIGGGHTNPLREQMLIKFSKNPPYDEYGMLPYLDELIGVDWVIDGNRYDFTRDEDGKTTWALSNDVDKGKLKDPRDVDSTLESRKEFDYSMDSYLNGMVTGYGNDIPNDWTEKEAKLFNDTMILSAKLASIIPPQGFTNAPRYFSPERLDFIYKKHYLDSKLDPRIPAIERYNFPEDLKAKIRAYAKEHNIQE